MLFHDENTNERISNVMEEFMKYTTKCCVGLEKTYLINQGIIRQQLSVECGINHLLQVANGLTSEERKEGMHMKIADFHSQMKFLQVILTFR